MSEIKKQETVADALNVGAATTEKSSAVGNAAAMREALEKVHDYLLKHPYYVDEEGMMSMVIDALSAPPTISEEYAKPKLCKSCAHYRTDGCEICGCTDYKERKGETKE